MHSDAETVDAYLDALPADRRQALEAVRHTILASLPEGYEEAMNWGMIAYEVPLATCPDTYNGKPLMYAALASQKNHMAVYLCGLYCMAGLKERFEAAYAQSGRKLDMGAACVRFKRLEQLDLDAVADAIGAVPVADFVAASEAAHAGKRKRPARKRGTGGG